MVARRVTSLAQAATAFGQRTGAWPPPADLAWALNQTRAHLAAHERFMGRRAWVSWGTVVDTLVGWFKAGPHYGWSGPADVADALASGCPAMVWAGLLGRANAEVPRE